MFFNMRVSTTKTGSEVTMTVEVPEEIWDEMSEKEREDYGDDLFDEFLDDLIDGSWEFNEVPLEEDPIEYWL